MVQKRSSKVKTNEFEIRPEHLKLLQRMVVDWEDCEFGAPSIDCKRPYGNSDVHQDMLEILGLRELRKGVYEFELGGSKWLLKGEDKYNIYLDGADEESLLEALNRLHEETKVALQICLSLQSFSTGHYVEKDYGDWVKKV